jgi:hypothetical protein
MMVGALVCNRRLMVLKEAPSASIRMMLSAKDVVRCQGTRLSNAVQFEALIAGKGNFTAGRHTSLEA